MTHITPHSKTNILANPYRLITILSILFGVASLLTLIGLYNAVVQERHAVRDMEEEIAFFQTENVLLEEQLLTNFDVSMITAFAQERGLVKERNPRYLEVSQAPWAVASVSQY
mgnify:CR=1 FL=1